MARAAITVMYVSRQSVARADFRAGRAAAPFGLWVQPRPELPDLASAVEYGLSLGPKPGRAVWVLSTDLWVQIAALPAMKVSGLSSADLEQALNFEAESLSGISALEGAVGAVAFPASRGERPCWLVQMRAAERDLVGEVVDRAGSTLAGICHPSGLPRSVTRKPDASFARIELWPDAVIGIRQESHGPLELHVMNSDPLLGRWQAEVTSWGFPPPSADTEEGRTDRVLVGPVGTPFPPANADDLDGRGTAVELLVADGYPTPTDRAKGALRLDDPERFAGWLSTWAAELMKRAPAVPVVRSAVRPMSALRRTALAAALTAVVVAMCSAHWFTLNQKQQELNASLAAARPDPKEAEYFRTVAAQQATERDKLRAEANRLEIAVTRIDQYRERYPKLLEVLAQYKPEEVVVLRIEHDAGNPKIVGLALRPDLPHQYARALTAPLRPLGWEVQAAKEADLKMADGGGPWSFEFIIRDATPTKPLAPNP